MPNRRPTPDVGFEAPEAGFTLIELLIVMSVILILITLAVPGYEAVHKKTNETSAMNSVRALHSAETEYNTQYPSRGYACTLAQLGGKQGAGLPTPDAAQLIADDLASGNKAGYNFTIKCGDKNTTAGVDQYNSIQIFATPVSLGKTGNRGFCTDDSGQIRFDPQGGTNCTELLQ
jgi:type IV pilus assembly protein PilA